jgi:Ala-tRNA(Pro) deacylase
MLVDRWLEYLDLMQVKYSHSTHSRAETAFQTAEAERMPAHDLAKTVVYFGEGGFGLAVVPADQFVDLAEVCHVRGLYCARLATEPEILRVFPDCELGAMPPFGDFCDLPVTVDESLARDFITFTLASHCDIVRMSFRDFGRLAQPMVAPIAIGRECWLDNGFPAKRKVQPCSRAMP